MKKVLFTILLSIVFNKSLLANDISNASKYTLKECTGYGEIWNVNVDLKKNILTLSYDHLGNNFTSTPISIFKNQNDILVTEKFLLKDIADYRNNYTSDQKITYLNVSSQIEVFPLLNKFTLDLKSIPNSDKKIKRAIKEVFGESEYENTSTYNCMSLQVTKINQNKIKKESKVAKVENKKNSQINEKKSQEQATKVVTVKKNNLDKKSLKEELKYWKELFEDELITKAEYDQKRKELLEGGVQETQVITTKVEEPKKEVVKKIIKPKIDMSYKNKNYLYPKIDKKFNAWSTEKIINRCMSDFRKTLEAIMCMQKNIRATNRYKKGGRGYMDLYNLHITASGNVEDAFLNGLISESEGKTYLVTLNSQIINALNVREAQLDSNKPNGDALIQLGQEMMKPGFDWSTGKATNNSQSNSSSFYSCVLKAPLSGIGSGLKGSSIGTIECN